MKIYVIGPVTGRKDYNMKAFEDAQKTLEKAGYRAFIPHQFVKEGAPWEAAMRRSIETMMKMDGVAVLSGTPASKGASIEKHLADSIGIPVKAVSGWVKWAKKDH